MGTVRVWAGAQLLAFVLLHPAFPPISAASATLAPLSFPVDGGWFGVSVNTSAWDDLREYGVATDVQPVSFVIFISLPLSSYDIAELETVLPQIAAMHAVVMVTIEPHEGLEAVTEEVVSELADILHESEKEGATIIIRFAHEMNGSWYTWGQRPSAFIAAYRLVVSLLRSQMCNPLFVWAPNSGDGYPWPGLPNEVKQGMPDFALLDTNGDGVLTSADDMYTPYYPGDDVVDLVGMSVYWFGARQPYGDNNMPEDRMFTRKITGTDLGIPNFYSMFTEDHGKPMVICETSALFNTEINANESIDLAIKSKWWEQVFNPGNDTANALSIREHFPNIKMVHWFDRIKPEGTAGNDIIDWRGPSGQAPVREALSRYLKESGYWKELPEFNGGHACSSRNLGDDESNAEVDNLQ